MTRVLLLLSLAFVACGPPSSEVGSPWNPLRREVPEFAEGISAYKDSRWVDAEGKFQAFNDKTPSSAGHFDIGSTQYKQKKMAEAGESFRKVLSSKSEDERERAYFNLGNTEAAGGDLEKAKEEYRRALELHPFDMDARYNLEWAQRMLDQAKDDKNKKDGGDKQQDDKKGNGDKNQAQNDKKDGDKKQEGADKKKDEEKGKGEEKNQAQNDKKDGDKQPGEDEKAPGEKKEGDKPEDAAAGEPKNADGKSPEDQKPGTQAGAGNEKPLHKEETAAILDSLQAGEKNLQMWKFQQNGKPTDTRSQSDKPW